MSTTCGSLSIFSVYPVQVNWRQVADDIKQVNPELSYNRQAAAIGAGWSTFEGWLNSGYEPRYSMGEALLRLHTQVCGHGLTEKRLTEEKDEA